MIPKTPIGANVCTGISISTSSFGTGRTRQQTKPGHSPQQTTEIVTSNAIPTFGTFHQSKLINIGGTACSDFEDTYQLAHVQASLSALVRSRRAIPGNRPNQDTTHNKPRGQPHTGHAPLDYEAILDPQGQETRSPGGSHQQATLQRCSS